MSRLILGQGSFFLYVHDTKYTYFSTKNLLGHELRKVSIFGFNIHHPQSGLDQSLIVQARSEDDEALSYRQILRLYATLLDKWNFKN